MPYISLFAKHLLVEVGNMLEAQDAQDIIVRPAPAVERWSARSMSSGPQEPQGPCGVIVEVASTCFQAVMVIVGLVYLFGTPRSDPRSCKASRCGVYTGVSR